MTRLHVLYEHSADLRPHGCSYIRLLLPLDHPANAGHWQVTSGTDYSGGADVVIVERMWKPDGLSLDSAEQLVRQVRQSQARLIYTLDDNLLDLRPPSFAQAGVTEIQQMFVRQLLREADGVIVSTAPLAERVRQLSLKVKVVPNAVDERLFVRRPSVAEARSQSARMTIGFMGTFSHDADLWMILQPLRAVLRQYQERIELQLVGGVADAALVRAFEGLPVRVLDVQGHSGYPAFVRWMTYNLRWDLALAPLEDTPFTRCKSDLKFLDYSALGIPGLYSRVPVYADTVRHLETGGLADNTVEAWQEALERLVADGLLRRQLARNAYDYVWSQRTLKQCAHQWREAIEALR